MKRMALIATLFAASFALGQDSNVPSLTEESYASWKTHIVPSEADLAFQNLPWEVTFADGLAAAAESGKPLFLWVMNGHPLGCT